MRKNPECIHASASRSNAVFCRLLSARVTSQYCQSCSLRVPGSAIPLIADEVPIADAPPPSPCLHLGEVFHEEPCSCGSRARIKISRCSHPDTKGRCVPLQSSWSMIAGEDERLAVHCCEACPLHSSKRRKWITVEELNADASRLAGLLAGECDEVIGVARSGLTPAALVAQLLHVPLRVMRQDLGDIIDAGHGWRLGDTQPSRSSVVIDDTCCSGVSASRSRQILGQLGLKARLAVVYCEPASSHAVDHFVRSLPSPHVLEWNIANSVYTDQLVWDIDGLICEDCPAECDDDGPRYSAWLDRALPKCLPRRSPVRIATGRREKWRSQTLDWLTRHGVTVQSLHMHPDGVRSGESIISHKASACRDFAALRGASDLPIMLESDPLQAAEIESQVGWPVYHC